MTRTRSRHNKIVIHVREGDKAIQTLPDNSDRQPWSRPLRQWPSAQPGFNIRLSWLTVLVFSVLYLPLCVAQTSSSALSTSTLSSGSAFSSSSTSLSSSSSSSSASIASSQSSAAPAATPSVAISGLPITYELTPLNSTYPALSISIPAVSTLWITLNIVSLADNVTALPTVLLSTASPASFSLGSRSSADADSGGTNDGGYNRLSRSGTTWELIWDKGFANWTLTGGVSVGPSVLIGLSMDTDGNVDHSSIGEGNVIIQLTASQYGPVHSLSPQQPFLGDTTSTSALLFSPVVLSMSQVEPIYPNYTLPGAEMLLPTYDTAFDSGNYSDSSSFGASPNLTLILIPTSISPTESGLDLSYAAVLSANATTGGIASLDVLASTDNPQWMRVDSVEGFRSYWVVGNLTANTNYTAWILDVESGTLSKPTWLITKDDTFSCPLLLPSAICPAIGYASPVADISSSPLRDLPNEYISILTSNLEAFSTTLLSQACGRDMYSHVSTCLDCYTAYRDWLCRIVLPQCAATNTDSSVYPVASTIARTPSTPRNPSLPVPSYNFNELLPCIVTCTTVDLACPAPLVFRCPSRGVNANSSYAFLGENSDVGDGSSSGEWPALDSWGNRWCNG